MNNIFSQSFIKQTYLGNTIEAYLIALAVFLGALIVFKLFQYILLSRFAKFAKKTTTDIDDTLIEIVNSVKPSFYSFIAFYIALKTLIIQSFVERIITVVLIFWSVFMVVSAVQILINHVVRKRMGSEEDRGAKMAAEALGLISKIALWSFALLFILSNLGINITSLIAGLGVGGIAIAFALQNILSDLFSSFSIFFDKPFVIGDFIIVGDHMGVVEKIGIKTTRIKALQGEEIVISNTELTSTRVRNFKHMKERRIVFGFGVTYDTPSEKIKSIPDIVREVIDSVVGDVRFDRAHFKSFGESSLDFEIVYYVGTGDYNKYMDINQAIHQGIKEKFDQASIEMAFPTRTLYMNTIG